jgi:hypothetical protein
MYDRWYFLATFVSGYVALAALRHAGADLPVLVVLVGNPLLLAWAWRKTRPGMGLTRGAVHATALGAARVCVAGMGLWLAARVASVARPTFDLAANLGLAGAVVAAQVALARIVHRQGLIKPPRSARSLVPAISCAVLWLLGAALPAARALWPDHDVISAPLASSYVTRVVSVVSWGAMFANTLRCWLTQRLAMGVAERAAGAIALSLTVFGAAALAMVGGFVPPDHALSLGVLGTALACVWASTTEDAAAVSSAWRVALTLTLLGAPVALVAGLLANEMPRHAGVITITACTLAVGLGSLARGLARSLAPDPSRWLAALNAACRAALVPEPNAAIVATLESLQALDRRVRTRPELWRADPPQVLSVDVAGYLHSARGEPPSGIFELMRSEPEHMLRQEVLAHLEVRRPEVRPVLAWMEARDAFAITLVCDDQEQLGFVLFPRGRRTATATLAEAEAARQLADRLSAVLSLSSSMARAREREQGALGRADALAREVARLEGIIAEHKRPRDLLIDALAASVRVATYSARARLTLEQVQRLGAADADATLEVPVGVDPLGWACVFHLASPRRAGPLVVADGTAATSHAAEHWTEPLASPAARARGGTLLLLNAAAMPHAAQDALAIALSERGTTDGLEPYAFIATVAGSPRELLDARHLSRALAQFLLPDVVRLPTLLERAEDLRGLVLDRLCRSGVRYAGEPLGIEPQAMSLLVDHTWPGNEAELASVVEQAARVACGERVSVADLSAIGFVGTPLESEPVLVLPRRRSERTADASAPDESARERPLVRRRRRR